MKPTCTFGDLHHIIQHPMGWHDLLVNLSSYTPTKDHVKRLSTPRKLEVVSLEVPNTSKVLSPEDYENIQIDTFEKILELRPAYVHIDIEDAIFSWALVNALLDLPIECFTTVFEKKISLKNGQKTVEKEFVCFRPFA